MDYLQFFYFLALSGFCAAAPKPIDWDEIGTKIRNFGEKALPVARGACGVLNSLPQSGYPQVQGYYPSVQTYYPPQGRGFPQAPGFPVYIPPTQNNYPQFGYNFPQYPGIGSGYYPPTQAKPPSNLPPTTVEQDDLNGGGENPLNKPSRIPLYIPPEGEGIFVTDSEEDFLGNVISEAGNPSEQVHDLLKKFKPSNNQYKQLLNE